MSFMDNNIIHIESIIDNLENSLSIQIDYKKHMKFLRFQNPKSIRGISHNLWNSLSIQIDCKKHTDFTLLQNPMSIHDI